jgi:hypothetical protein
MNQDRIVLAVAEYKQVAFELVDLKKIELISIIILIISEGNRRLNYAILIFFCIIRL